MGAGACRSTRFTVLRCGTAASTPAVGLGGSPRARLPHAVPINSVRFRATFWGVRSRSSRTAMALLTRALPLSAGKQAGLSLLLSASSHLFSPSSVLVKAASLAVGVGMPVYGSICALEDQQLPMQRKWLGYWSVYGCLHVVESTVGHLVSWLPMYHHVKLGFLVWLQLPPDMGFVKVYTHLLRPAFHRHRGSIDPFLSSVSRHVEAWRVAHETEARLVGRVLNSFTGAVWAVVRTCVHIVSGMPNTDDTPKMPRNPVADLTGPPTDSGAITDADANATSLPGTAVALLGAARSVTVQVEPSHSPTPTPVQSVAPGLSAGPQPEHCPSGNAYSGASTAGNGHAIVTGAESVAGTGGQGGNGGRADEEVASAAGAGMRGVEWEGVGSAQLAASAEWVDVALEGSNRDDHSKGSGE